MNPCKVKREQLQTLTDLPNIGEAMAQDLRSIGIHTPQDVIGRDAYVMYQQLCRVSGQRHDPCVIDVFLSIVDFMAGGKPQVWWAYTDERKAFLQHRDLF